MQKFTLGPAVLAGGRSSRMGQNKVLMEYQNRRFLDRICEELQGFDEKPSPDMHHCLFRAQRYGGKRCSSTAVAT